LPTDRPRKLGFRNLEVVDDLLGEDVRRRQVVDVLERGDHEAR
jgi:hypothetical protein